MSKAAKILNISQSTLSKSIAKLEAEIGCPLFSRNGRNIKLNSSGRMFFEYSVKVLDILDTGVKKTRMLDKPDEARVRVCISGACDEMVKCIAEFESQNPYINFDVDGVMDYEEAPNINEYDVMVCPDSPRYLEYPGYNIGMDKMCLCVSKKHPLADKIAVSVKDLTKLDTVFLKKGSNVESVQWGLEALSIKTGKVYYVNNFDLHRHMIAENIAVGYVLEGMSKQYASSDQIKLLPILDSRFSISMKMVFKRDNRLSEEAKKFKEYAMKYFNLI